MSKAKSGNGVDGRAVTAVVPAQRTLEGEQIEVRRAIPGPGFQSVGPFIMFDHFGPKDYGPGEALGAPEHPHFGIETLTYMFEGFGLHRDSIGNISITGPLEAQWMRAGRGIVHDEGADPEARRLGDPCAWGPALDQPAERASRRRARVQTVSRRGHPRAARGRRRRDPFCWRERWARKPGR